MFEVDKIKLARLEAPDDRDKKFLLSSRLDTLEIPTSGYKYWYQREVENQGSTPHCVGYAWRAMMTSVPVRQWGIDASNVYHEAQKVDEWEGEDYDGTSVRAGAKVLKSWGKLKSYGWAWDLEATLAWLWHKGPVVMGTWWHEDMFWPDSKGYIQPTGQKAGGHAYILQGLNIDQEKVRLINSWGRDWGQSGRAWIKFEDLESLIIDFGEVCTALE